MITQTKETQAALNPNTALELLKEGNKRFVEQNPADRDLLAQVAETTTGQYPFATILSCIDSRVSAELIFDQGVGSHFGGLALYRTHDRHYYRNSRNLKRICSQADQCDYEENGEK